MPARDPLSDDAIDGALPDGWRRQSAGAGNAIVAEFAFDDFRTAWAFLTRVAFEAEGMDHHPEITNVYGTVRLALATHDAGDRVTETDLALARRIAALPGA